MSINLYNALRKIEDVNSDEAQAIANKVAYKDEIAAQLDFAFKNVVATKADLAELKAELTWRIIIVFGISTAVNGAIVTIVTLL